jgi:hypothetical protein
VNATQENTSPVMCRRDNLIGFPPRDAPRIVMRDA